MDLTAENAEKEMIPLCDLYVLCGYLNPAFVKFYGSAYLRRRIVLEAIASKPSAPKARVEGSGTAV